MPCTKAQLLMAAVNTPCARPAAWPATLWILAIPYPMPVIRNSHGYGVCMSVPVCMLYDFSMSACSAASAPPASPLIHARLFVC